MKLHVFFNTCQNFVSYLNVLGEVELHTRLNTTVTRLIDSLINGFHLFMDTSNTIIQVDQPLIQFYYGNIYMSNTIRYGTTDQQQRSPRVSHS